MQFKDRRTVAQKQRDTATALLALRDHTQPYKPQPLRTKPDIKSTQSEADVLAACLKYLKSLAAYHPAKFDRLNNGAGYTVRGGWSKFGIKGAGDIVGTLAGRHFEIECKAGKGGQLSLEQLQRKADVERSGGAYLIVHSRDELEQRMQSYLDKCPVNEGVAVFKTNPDGTTEIE